MRQNTIEYTGVVARIKWRKPCLPGEEQDPYVIASLECGGSVKGIAPPRNFEEGATYRFFGYWEPPHPKFGKTFVFSSYCQAEPVSRRGLIRYLEKHAANVGPVVATRLFDAYGGAACRVIREDPERVAREIQGMNLDKAREAAATLAEKAKFEDTRIALTNLLDGRGFGASIYDKAIEKFGAIAPDRIRRDPFCLLTGGFPGAGFLRCDRLYCELGLPPGKIKRQVICLWNAIREDRAGHTWFRCDSLAGTLQAAIGSATPNLNKALKIGAKAKWLTMRRDSNGVWWVADAAKAKNETMVAESIAAIMAGPVVLPLFTEALPGECDGTPAGDDCAELIEELLNAREKAAFLTGAAETLPDGSTTFDYSDPRETDWAAMVAAGKRTGICQFCGRQLLKTESKSRGYGPICAAKYGLPWGEPETESESNPESSSRPTTAPRTAAGHSSAHATETVTASTIDYSELI